MEQNPEEVKDIWVAYKAHCDEARNYNNQGRGASKGGHGHGNNLKHARWAEDVHLTTNNPAPVAPNTITDQNDSHIVGSVWWATSADKAPPQPSSAVSGSTRNYFDQSASDSGDDADFEFGFDLEESQHKHKSSSYTYRILAYAR